MSYFQIQKKPTPKQIRWQEFLTEFDLSLEYKIENTNIITDALSKKAELIDTSVQISETQVEGTLLARINEGMHKMLWHNN